MEPANVIRLDPTQEDAIRNNRCYMGGEQVVIAMGFGPAEGPGHIYSEAGLREYRLSGACEYHFDQLAEEPPQAEDFLEKADWPIDLGPTDRRYDHPNNGAGLRDEPDEPMSPEEEEQFGTGSDPWDEPPDDIDD
jgi:hypothetical protein